MDGRSWTRLRGRLTCHCLLVETDTGLVLIDTGFGLRDVENPASRLSRVFLALLRPEFKQELTAVRQIERLGFSASDVRHIVLSHLDFDHAGGLDDFPLATVHMLAEERSAASAQKTLLDRMRFRPQQWSSAQRWRVYPLAHGEDWLGFEHVRTLDGLPPEILMVPLIGHTLGHCGVALRRQDDWLFYAGDAYFYHGEMALERPSCTPGLRMYQWLMEKNRGARLDNQTRLRELRRARGREVSLFCAHDPLEFEHLRLQRIESRQDAPSAPDVPRMAADT
jgi:glyoxylase-like metal-dependent hydrolase (beta-lactamase superfamily II)